MNIKIERTEMSIFFLHSCIINLKPLQISKSEIYVKKTQIGYKNSRTLPGRDSMGQTQIWVDVGPFA